MADPTTRGRFITFEGVDGAGKSTQARKLGHALEALGVAVRLTREPGGSPGAEQIRDLLITGETDRWDAMTEALLLSAARRDHWLRLIDPALAAGQWVISDRFADSTFVYQGAAGGIHEHVLARLHGLALGDIRPDLTLLLDVPVPLGLDRTRRREQGGSAAQDRFENRSGAFLDRLRAGFLARAHAEPERIVVIDASRAPDAVAATTVAAVRSRFARDLAP